MPDNLLYHGDDLDILRRYVKEETTDLVYLDLWFKSTLDDNMLFAEQDGSTESHVRDIEICRSISLARHGSRSRSRLPRSRQSLCVSFGLT